MAAFWVRLRSGESVSFDSETIEPRIRYKISGFPQAQIVTAPSTVLSGGTTGDPLPAIGSIHEDYPAGPGVPFPPRLDRYDVQVDGKGAVVGAVGLYSRNGKFRIPVTPSIPDDFLSFGGGATPLQYEIPIARRVYDYGAVRDSTDQRPLGHWEVDAFIHTAHAARRTASVRIDAGALTHEDRYRIDRAVGHIHGLEFEAWTQKFQFAGWSHTTGEDKVDIRYEWVSDPGTELLDFDALFAILGPDEQGAAPGTGVKPRFDPPIAGQGGIPPLGFEFNLGSAGVVGFLRPPFHALLYIPPPDHRNFGEYAVQKLADDEDFLDEWRTFPGLLP